MLGLVAMYFVELLVMMFLKRKQANGFYRGAVYPNPRKDMMMLTVRIINDGEGVDWNASYDFYVFVNGKEIHRGKVSGHNRDDGWATLLKMIANGFCECEETEIARYHGTRPDVCLTCYKPPFEKLESE